MRTKEFKIRQYPNVRFSAGTEDRDLLKACYIELSSTFQCDDDYTSNINQTIYDIKQSVYSAINKEILRDRFLTTPNIPEHYYITGRGFTKIEFTFFLKKKVSLTELSDELNIICDKIYHGTFNVPKKMTFNKKFITKRNYAKK